MEIELQFEHFDFQFPDYHDGCFFEEPAQVITCEGDWARCELDSE